MRILIVEDEKAIADVERAYIRREGYEADIAADGVTALSMFAGEEYAMVLLDLMLPGMRGEDVCKEIRKVSDVPIIMITAKSGEDDVIAGLDAGADDYVIKPFRTFEFIARIKALLRRTGMQNGKKVKKGIKSGKYELDLQKQILQKDGVRIDLTRTEYQILCSLLANAPNLVAREFLLDTIWDFNENYIDDNTLSVHISRLREKIGGGQIRTVRGVGYQWQGA